MCECVRGGGELWCGLRGSPSAISMAVIPRDHWSLWKEGGREGRREGEEGTQCTGRCTYTVSNAWPGYKVPLHNTRTCEHALVHGMACACMHPHNHCIAVLHLQQPRPQKLSSIPSTECAVKLHTHTHTHSGHTPAHSSCTHIWYI